MSRKSTRRYALRAIDPSPQGARPTEWAEEIIVVPLDFGVDLEYDGGHIATFVPEDDR